MIALLRSYVAGLPSTDVKPALIHAALEPCQRCARRSGHGLTRDGKGAAVTGASDALRLCVEGQGAAGVSARKVQSGHVIRVAAEKYHSSVDVHDAPRPIGDHLIDGPEIDRADALPGLWLQILQRSQRERRQSRSTSNCPKP